MPRIHSLLATLLSGLVVACLIAAYLTSGATPNPPAPTDAAIPIDGRMYLTAKQVFTVADSAEEQDLAGDAVRLSDHELDQNFASALREAAAVVTPQTGPLKELADRAAGWSEQVSGDKERVAKATAQGAAAPPGELDLAQAQLALDQDELEDAQQDLARQGGDPHAAIQRALQQHEAVEHQPPTPAKIVALDATVTLYDQARAWFALNQRLRLIDDARKQAAAHESDLEKEHNALEALADNKLPPSGARSLGRKQKQQAEATATMVSRLQRLSDQRKSLADLDKRIQDTRQLTDTYAQWVAVVQARRTGVLHLLLNSVALGLTILLVAVLIDFGVRRAFQRQSDPRRFHQAQVITTVALQFVAAVLVVLVILGPPNQVSTLIGLATAGITVAMRDFILAFFGYFALMGRNGIRMGDWVEIRGVGGEVVELGVFKTVLLEVGDSGSTGHPTGRRVSFVNSFAIEGNYFNFSTEGKWLWDELQVSLPASSDPYQLATQIRDVVERETLANAGEAEKDWERVTHQYGTRPFSAKPIADLRPGSGGFNLIVRYITHAPERNQVKSRIFKAIVDVLHNPVGSEAKALPAAKETTVG
jgi:small-conductance mechanosensitive channel